MPLYEFRCRGCGHSFEKLCRLSEGLKEVECPRCRQPSGERQLSAPAVRTSDAKGAGCAPRGGFT